MSRRNRTRKMPQVNIDSARLQDAQDLVSRGARQAAQRVGPTTRQARRIAAAQMTRQMTNARRWGAPRIDQAGQYIEDQVGPRVGALLHRTATKVEPGGRRRRRGLAALLLAVGGAIGAAGAIVTRRKAASTGEGSSPEHLSAVSENSSGEHAHSNG
jgi:hypothetical protein